MNVPSRKTQATPEPGSFTPIHVIPVPMKVIDAMASLALVSAASPLVLAELLLVYHMPLYVTVGSVLRTRVMVGDWAQPRQTEPSSATDSRSLEFNIRGSSAS